MQICKQISTFTMCNEMFSIEKRKLFSMIDF